MSTNLKTARSEEGLVNHISPIGHTDDEDIVELVDAVDFGEQLVNDGVVNARVAPDRTSSLADGVHLVENDNVQSARWSELQEFVDFRVKKQSETISDALKGGRARPGHLSDKNQFLEGWFTLLIQK